MPVALAFILGVTAGFFLGYICPLNFKWLPDLWREREFDI